MTTRITLILAAGLVLIALAYLLTPSPAPPPSIAPQPATSQAVVPEKPAQPAPVAEAPAPPAEPEEPPLAVTVKQVKCVKVIEPYVFQTDAGETFRLLGLRLPEHANTKEAIKRIIDEQTVLLRGMELRLEIINEKGADGRPLAFAYYPNRMMANRGFIARGYASVDTTHLPEKMAASFTDLERSAIESRFGLWQMK